MIPISSTRRRRALVAVTAAAAAASLLLSGCSAGQAEPASGGDLTVSIPYSGLNNLDPAGPAASNLTSLTADRAIFDTLVRFQDGEIVPSLATDWEVDGNQEFTFTLRDDVTFSDGSSFDAEDVKASIERVAQATTPFASFWKPVVDIEVSSPTSIVLRTDKPRSDLLSNLLVLYIIPSEMKDADMTSTPIGSGPFLVDSFVPSESLRLVANPGYWGGAPSLDSLTFREIPELSSRVIALSTGEIDVTWNLPQDQLQSLRADDSIVLDPVASTSTYAFWFNSSKPALSDARVRQALWYGVDFASIQKSLLADTATPSIGVLPANIPGAVEQEPYSYDPEKATELLDEAGFDYSSTIEIQYKDDDFTQIADVMVSDWKKIGVQGVAVRKDPATWIADRNGGNYDVNLGSTAYPTYDASYNLSRLYTCAAQYTRFCDDDLDAALAGIINSTTDKDRESALTKAQSLMWVNAISMFPYDLVSVWGVNARVRGFSPDPAQIPDFSKTSVSP